MLGLTENIHDKLCIIGAIPVAGAVVSIAHAILSVAQLIAALATTILLGLVKTLSCQCLCPSLSDTLVNTLTSSGTHLQLGLGGLIYSTINILSLGIFGYRMNKIHYTSPHIALLDLAGTREKEDALSYVPPENLSGRKH